MGLGVGEYNVFANGNIPVSTIVKRDTTQSAGDYVVTAQAATDNLYAIACEETHVMPIVISGNNLDDGYAGVAGGPAFKAYGPGATNVPLRIGGTVTNGDKLTVAADTTGRGITTTSSGNSVIAIARASGVADDIIPVDVVRFDV